MEYLNKVLGIKVTYEDVEFKHLPNFIVMRYRLQMASMNGKKAIFLYPKTELEQIGVLKKHVARIQKNENLPVVLVLKEIISRQKEYLIREKIPFVVEGRQIYLPFMALYLQEWCNAEREQREEMRPSAQMLLLHFIYGGAQELSTSQAAKEFVGTALLESGYSALAECSMLNAPNVKYYATERISQWKDVMTNRLQDSQVQVAVEMWRYNPRKLSTRNTVDELSLALALREDADERVEEAVEEMLNELWRKIDGYRD